MSITISEALQRASFQLRGAGLEAPRKEAELLLCAAAQLPLARLYAHPQELLDQDVYERYTSWVARRSMGEPYAYLCGKREFMGLPFDVSPAVLIPRPETELLVQAAIEAVRMDSHPHILEIGTGSGAIAVSLAVLLPQAQVTAVDISSSALAVAAKNAIRYRVQDRVRLLQGDLYAPVLGEMVDIIVSNPPYIPTEEITGLDKTVKDYEPRTALDGGPDGLDFYRRLTGELSVLKAPPAFMAVEVGMGQADAVSKLFTAARYKKTRQIADLAGIKRVVIAHH